MRPVDGDEDSYLNRGQVVNNTGSRLLSSVAGLCTELLGNSRPVAVVLHKLSKVAQPACASRNDIKIVSIGADKQNSLIGA